MVACWSFNFIIGKVGLRYIPPLTLASFRVILAAVIMLPVFWLARRVGSSPARAFARRDFWTFAYLGLLGVAGNQFCFTVGLSYTTVGHSALIMAMGPIFILLLARLQGLEALTLRKVLGVATAFAGVTVLAAEHGLSLRSATLRGDLITLTGSVAFSIYTVLGKKVAAEYDSVSMNTFNYIAGAVVILPLAMRQARGLSRDGSWGQIGWPGWVALVYMAVCASVVAYLIYFWVLRHMTATRLAALSYLHLVLTPVLGILLLGERVTGHLVIGGALALGGVGLLELGPRENQLADKYSSQ